MKRLLPCLSSSPLHIPELPIEIWYSIFMMVQGGETWYLIKAPAVCKLWACVISRCVYEIGSSSMGITACDAIFRRAPLTRRLCVRNNTSRISGEGLQGLTALTSLTLKTAKQGPSKLLTGLTNLTYLDCLSAYHLPVNAPELQYLKLSNNKLISGDELVKKYPQLHTLDVWNCREVSPLHIGSMTNLRTLTFQIQEHRHEESAHFLSHLTSLTSLELVNCNSVSEASIARLTGLTSLDLYFSDAGNRLMTYSFIQHLSSLTRLIIFDRTPAASVNLFLPTSLVTLDLHSHFAHALINVGKGISHLANLTDLSTNAALHLTHSLFESLPKLVHLKALGLSAPYSLWQSARGRFLTLDCVPIVVVKGKQ